MLRLLGILGTVMFAIAVAVLTWPSFFRLERTFPIAQIVSFRGLLAIALRRRSLVVALLLAIARPMRAFALTVALIAVVAVVANVAVVTTRGVGTDTLPAKTEDSIRVMTWNTAGSATTPEAVAQIAVAMDADIVTLPETTIETGEKVALAMRDLDHPMWAHYTDYASTQWDARLDDPSDLAGTRRLLRDRVLARRFEQHLDRAERSRHADRPATDRSSSPRTLSRHVRATCSTGGTTCSGSRISASTTT